MVKSPMDKHGIMRYDALQKFYGVWNNLSDSKSIKKIFEKRRNYKINVEYITIRGHTAGDFAGLFL